MWLLDASTKKLKWFLEQDAVETRYAILSHTWGDDEVLFADLENPRSTRQKSGYDKISMTCQQAQKDRLDFVWIDTCCIDKSSSAELSEAINSMFRWYQNAEVCYAYLSDLSIKRHRIGSSVSSLEVTEPDLAKCKWFTRGWTLQELIAPYEIKFYAEGWHYIGSRSSLHLELQSITQVPVSELITYNDKLLFLQNHSAAKKMSWVSERTTSRSEDCAYSLLGIFNVNMPLLYGEGGDKAFIRLQVEILRATQDLSLLLWTPPIIGQQRGILATSPSRFWKRGGIYPCPIFHNDPREPFELITAPFPQLRVTLPIVPNKTPFKPSTKSSCAILQFRHKDHNSRLVALELGHRAAEARDPKEELIAYLPGHAESSYTMIRAYRLQNVKMQRFVLTDFKHWSELEFSLYHGCVCMHFDDWCFSKLSSKHINDKTPATWETIGKSMILGFDDLPATLSFLYRDYYLVFTFKTITPPGIQPLVFYHVSQTGESPETFDADKDAREQDWTWIMGHDQSTRVVNLGDGNELHIGSKFTESVKGVREWRLNLSQKEKQSISADTSLSGLTL